MSTLFDVTRKPLVQRIYCGHGITRSHTAERLTFRSRAERGHDLVERLLRVTKKHLGVGLEEDGVVGPGVPAPRARARRRLALGAEGGS